MGILKRIKNRLPIVGGGRPEQGRPAAAYTPPAASTVQASRPAPPPPADPAAVRAEIEQTVKDHAIVVYMKGTARAPQCGFSAAVVGVFDGMGVPYETRNVLDDPMIRSTIKEITDWPTIPQVFVAGEFIGGCDIVREMDENGELKALVEQTLQAAPAQ